jgi:hypothetical protein
MALDSGRLFRVLEWAKDNGDVTTMSRVRVMVLPMTVKERIVLDRVGPATTCSTEYLEAVRRAVNNVVGKECPL